jgi:hypothetical protein
LVVGGTQEKKTENKTIENISLPLLRITTIEFLDPLTLEGTDIFLPMSDLLAARAVSDFATGSPYNGFVRLYFRDAVNAWATRAATRFAYEAFTFRPVAEEQGSLQGTPSDSSGAAAGSTIVLSNGNFTEAGGFFGIGYRIEILGGASVGTYTVIGGSYASGPDETTLTIREALPGTFSTEDWLWHVGIAESNIAQDSATGLFYWDIEVEVITGTPILLEGTLFAVTNLSTEGWSLETVKSVLSYSTLELPYLRLSEWVNDTTEILVDFTAPAIRVTYEYVSRLVDVQTFADDPDNRITAEDVLIRHFVPSYVRTQLSVRDITSAVAEATIASFVSALDPTQDLELSDVSDALYDVGCTKVMMPVTLVGLTQNRDRSWTGSFSVDALTSSRIQHFLPDTDFIIATEL